MQNQDKLIPLIELAEKYGVSRRITYRFFKNHRWVIYGNKSGGKRRYAYCLEEHAEKFREYCNQDIDGYITSAALAKECGVKCGAISQWLRSLHGRTRSLHAVKMNSRWYLSPYLAAEYKNGRAKFSRRIASRREKRPKGWVKVRSLIGDVNRTWLYDYLASSNLTTITDSKTLYISPEDAEMIRLTFRNDLPMAGWVRITEAAETYGIGYRSIQTWAEKCQRPIRKYRDVRTGQFASYLLESDIADYRAEEGERRAS